MPARPRLAEELMRVSSQLLNRYPGDPLVRQIARMTADQHFGNEIGMAYFNRGASGARAKQLVNEYEAMQVWIESYQGDTPLPQPQKGTP